MAETLKETFGRDPRFDEDILKAFENRKFVFFIGAGVSRIMGIPGWSDFSAAYSAHRVHPNRPFCARVPLKPCMGSAQIVHGFRAVEY